MSFEGFFERLPVLITGATGFIGSHLAARLVELGAGVRCLVRRTSRTEVLPAGVELVCGELTTGAGLQEAVRGARVVFHLAGVTKALAPEQFYRGNQVATRNLVQVLDESCCRLVHVSSLAAVGPSPDGRPLREEAQPRPVTHYGRSKLQAEGEVRGSAIASRAVIVRPPVVFGPRDTDVFELFRMAARGWMPVVGDPDALFSVIYVEDLVEGLLAAAASSQAAGRVYFMAAEVPLSWRGLAELSSQVLSRRVRTVRLPYPLAWPVAAGCELAARWRGRPAIISREKLQEARLGNWCCDASRARSELGFRARTPHAEAIARTLGWYREAGWLKS